MQSRYARSITARSIKARLCLGVLAVGTLSTACSFILGFGSDQCTTTADCEGKGPEYAGYTCSSANVCVPPFVPPDVVGGDGEVDAGCSTDEECTTANSGLPAICPTPGGACRQVGSNDCTVIGGTAAPYKDRNAIFVGHMTASTDPRQFLATVINRQAQLAFGEIATAMPGGRPGIPVNGARRPLVMVSCESGGDTLRDAANAQLLVNLNAPLIYVDNPQSAFAGWPVIAASGKKVAVMIGLATATIRDSLRGTGDVDQLFSMVLSIPPQASAFVAKTAEREAMVRAKPGFVGPDVRVALLQQTGFSGAAMEQLAVKAKSKLMFNGKNVTDNGANFRQFDVAFDKEGVFIGDVNAMAASIATFAPHIIVAAIDTTFSRVLQPLIESSWPAGQLNAEYIVPGTLANASTIDLVQGNDDLRLRIQGTITTPPIADLALRTEIINKVTQAYPASAPTTSTFWYDTIYAGLYAIAAGSRKSATTGTEVAAGLKEFGDSIADAGADGGGLPVFSVGPRDFINGLGRVGSEPVSLKTSQALLNFDPTTGEPKFTTMNIWCLNRNVATGAVTVNLASGQTFNLVTETLNGTANCP